MANWKEIKDYEITSYNYFCLFRTLTSFLFKLQNRAGMTEYDKDKEERGASSLVTAGAVLALGDGQGRVEGGGRVGAAHHLPQLLQAGQGQLGVSLFYVNL